MKPFAFIAAALIMFPLGLVMSVAVLGGGGAGDDTQAVTVAAAAACTYAVPDPVRITATMEQLTADPVDRQHWDLYAAGAGIDTATTTFESSTGQHRHDVLLAAVSTILYSTIPNAVTTPPVVWWHGSMPAGNDDTSWEATPVPGWDGALVDYIAAFGNTYATDPDVLAVVDDDKFSCTPGATSTCPQPANLPAILATIRDLESGDNYTEQSHSAASGYAAGSGNPSGAYQYLHSTWNRFDGYEEAYLAPAAVQDRRATGDVQALLTGFGSVAWVPVGWYVGSGGARRVRDGQWPLSYIPNPAYNRISIGDYQTKWMTHYTTIALPAVGVTPVECPAGATAVIAWADTQTGSPYAAISPYRFGTPRWPGGTLTGDRGNTYTYPAGTVVYDCSGFVIAAWRQAGLDLAGQYGIYGSQGFATSQLADAPQNALVPGDIAVYKPSDTGIGHVVLVHHVDPATGTVYTIEATPNGGVSIRQLNWPRVTSIKRPAITPG